MVFLNSSLYFVGLFLLDMCVFPFCFFLSLILTHLSTFLGYIQFWLSMRARKDRGNLQSGRGRSQKRRIDEKGRRTANTAESALFTFIGTLSSSGNLSISPHSIAKIGDFVADKEKQ